MLVLCAFDNNEITLNYWLIHVESRYQEVHLYNLDIHNGTLHTPNSLLQAPFNNLALKDVRFCNTFNYMYLLS